MAANEDVSTEIDLIAWWKRHAIELPKLANSFNKVLLVQPTVSCSREGLKSEKKEKKMKVRENVIREEGSLKPPDPVYTSLKLYALVAIAVK